MVHARSPQPTSSISIHRKGSSHPFVGVARFADYNAGQGLWSKMPAAMIAKCSEALALRKAFPADMSGVYSTDEMEQAAVEPVTVTAVAPAAGDDKLFRAGQAAIAKASSIDLLEQVRQRMAARTGQLSEGQQAELLQLMEQRETELMGDPLND